MIIEKEVIAHLSTMDIPVYAEIPANRPDQFVVVTKTGGSRQNFVYEEYVMVSSFSMSKLEAAVLDEAVQQIMYDIIERDNISSCMLSGARAREKDNLYVYESTYSLIHTEGN